MAFTGAIVKSLLDSVSCYRSDNLLGFAICNGSAPDVGFGWVLCRTAARRQLLALGVEEGSIERRFVVNSSRDHGSREKEKERGKDEKGVQKLMNLRRAFGALAPAINVKKDLRSSFGAPAPGGWSARSRSKS